MNQEILFKARKSQEAMEAYKEGASSSSIQFSSGFIPVNKGGRIYPSSNLSNSHSPSLSIHGVLFLQAHALALLLHLSLPRLLWSSSLPLVPHFKLQRFSQNVPIIPPQHMPGLPLINYNKVKRKKILGSNTMKLTGCTEVSIIFHMCVITRT